MKILVGILIIFFILVFMYTRAFQINKAPLKSPPGFWKRFAFYMNTHIAETSDNNIFEEMRTPKYKISPDHLFEKVKMGANKLGWKINNIDENNRELVAVIETKLFKFRDNIKVKVDSDIQGSKIYAYSKSSFSIGDMGANQRHIMDLLELLK